MDFKRVLEVCRGSNIFCQLVVQSIPQLKDRYPKTEWEELIGCTDVQICLGCNDVDTAKYISQKCGVTTIRVENNQMPIAPLFSPVYSTTRPYSQTKSNTQRPLMYLDEVLHMNNRECLVLLRGQNVLKLYKITPEEFPAFCRLKDVRVSSHTPRWRITEESERRHAPQPAQKPAPAADATPPQPPQAPPSPSATPSPPEVGIEREARREKRRPASEPQYSYGLMDSSLCGLEGDADGDHAGGYRRPAALMQKRDGRGVFRLRPSHFPYDWTSSPPAMPTGNPFSSTVPSSAGTRIYFRPLMTWVSIR